MSSSIDNLNNLNPWIKQLAAIIEKDENPEARDYAIFLREPHWALAIIAIINDLPEDDSAYYAACVLALEICVSQIHSSLEYGNKQAKKILRQLMNDLAAIIYKEEHKLNFWLPVLNIFYEAQVELISPLKNAYLNLVAKEEFVVEDGEEELSHWLNSVANLSDFEIAEHLFAQSYAMPPEFFADLVFNFYSMEAGEPIVALLLLHPQQEVRYVVVEAIDYLIDSIVISSKSLSRLQAIKHWYPETYHPQFDKWLKIQRRKGVVFYKEQAKPVIKIKASEVDGSGAQGVLIHVNLQRKNFLCGLLLKDNFGIKEVWTSPRLSIKDLARHYDDAQSGGVTLRTVDEDYLIKMVNHFLSVLIARGDAPELGLLQVQELLNISFRPESLNLTQIKEELSIAIQPFTTEVVQYSLNRSKNWTKSKEFTESWYLEHSDIDKLVNRCCSFVQGTKTCDLEEAIELLFNNIFETNRNKWLFHFLWIALWAKVKARKNETLWRDSFFIAYAIDAGYALKDIPIMMDICQQTVINSMETMEERKTYLNRE